MWSDNDTIIDLLDYQYLVSATTNIIYNPSLLPCTIGIYGDWGSGKSSLMRMVEKSLNEDDKILTIKFNGWLFEGYEDAKSVLMGTILEEIGEKKTIKGAVKLAKTGKKDGLAKAKLANKGEKIGKRKFNGPEIKYKILDEKDKLHVHVFRKDPVQDEWEIWVEICGEDKKGKKLKIYADDLLASKLKRRNEFVVRIRKVHNHHIRIYRTIEKPKAINNT